MTPAPSPLHENALALANTVRSIGARSQSCLREWTGGSTADVRR